MASNTMAHTSVVLPTKAACRPQQRKPQQQAMLGSTFAKGSSSQFAGQSLRLEASTSAGSSRKVTTMAAKGERRARRMRFRPRKMRQAGALPPQGSRNFADGHAHLSLSDFCGAFRLPGVWIDFLCALQFPDTSSLPSMPARPTPPLPSALPWEPRE